MLAMMGHKRQKRKDLWFGDPARRATGWPLSAAAPQTPKTRFTSAMPAMRASMSARVV